MKKSFLFALSAALLATSCTKDDNNKLDFPQRYCFATVMEVDVDSTSDDDVYFQLDSKKSFIVTDNVSKVDLEDLTVGDRVITGVTLTENVDDSYDYTAKLYDVISVIMGESATVTTEEESDAIADDKFTSINKEIALTQGYLNLLVGVQTSNFDDINFYLVENQFDEPVADDEDYLYLELRYDCAGTEGIGTQYEGYLSFDMESYREKLADMDGVMLRINTVKSEVTTVKVKSKDLFADEDAE